MRNGHWVILDELNLAPTDVLEALNRVRGYCSGARLHDEIFCSKKCFKRCWGSPCKPSTSCLHISTRVACYARMHIYDAAQRVLRGLVVSFGRYWQKELCSLTFISNRLFTATHRYFFYIVPNIFMPGIYLCCSHQREAGV